MAQDGGGQAGITMSMNCQKQDEDLILSKYSTSNIALNKTTYMSSTFSNFTSSNNAVDGQKTDLSYFGGQCAISKNEYKTAEWRVDLENLSSISNITIYFRTENLPWECDSDMYGPGCSLTCGACINNTQCHHINGSCLQGCGPGFYGRKCDEECPFGKYGINCQYNCSAVCKSPYNCSRTTGECVDGCQPGWKGLHCDQKCDNRTFGPGCGHKCGECINITQCNNINGICEFGCAPGFVGVTCNEECPFGKYGNSCADNCSRTCSTPHNCEGRTGNCIGGCQMGWKGVQCDQVVCVLGDVLMGSKALFAMKCFSGIAIAYVDFNYRHPFLN
ncbi:scavenger receptor class F member 2-like [Crassostrea angulata]|uniref:scavenger receptor class F member 2-like n=1 Tax=Magallana angulata TaxID=2784310 RepID=UPI0022B1B651|nr:scavenger receptor class F member 2-like [Crassostrea angulata]